MKIIKSIMHFLFSDCEPTHITPETGELWTPCYFARFYEEYLSDCMFPSLAADSCKPYPYTYVIVEQSRFGVWKKGRKRLFKVCPLPRYSK